ncbi:MAG: nucleotidyltransferase family protein [Candidatus Pacearchaeota archaeon]|nr:nucleotidyltransferase family protein [Candidatus Pacearchaeota archaeon]
MKAIVLAAGFATRLYPSTLNKSKSLLKVNNKLVIDYIIEKIQKIKNIDEIILVTNNNFYQDFLNWKKDREILTILNDGVSKLEDKLGAIGDLLFAINKRGINDNLLVISGDNLFDYSLEEPYEVFRREGKDLSLFYDTGNFEEAKRFGVALIENNFLVNFEEKPQNPKSTFCSSSTYFFKKSTIPLIKEFASKGLADQPGLFLQYLYKKVPIFAYVTQGKWLDIGTKESFEKAQREF